MSYKKPSLLVLAVLFTGSVFAEDIIIDQQIPFAEDADVKSNVRDECELGTKFSAFLNEYMKDKNFTAIKNDSKQALTKSLNVDTFHLLAPLKCSSTRILYVWQIINIQLYQSIICRQATSYKHLYFLTIWRG